MNMLTGIVNADQLARQIAEMSRQELTRAIQNFPGQFKMDFTEEYLSSLPLDRLQHILFAAQLQQPRN